MDTLGMQLDFEEILEDEILEEDMLEIGSEPLSLENNIDLLVNRKRITSIEASGETYIIDLDKVNIKLIITSDKETANEAGVLFREGNYILIPEGIIFPYRKIQSLSTKCNMYKVEGNVEIGEKTEERAKFIELIELEEMNEQ